MSATESPTSTDELRRAREEYVSRGLSLPPVAVVRASGARLWDPEGRSYIDFAGGIGCHNVGHGFGPVVAALHAQLDDYLHQCAMVANYEPYVAVCRRLAELSPCTGERQKSVLLNSGAEAVENAVKIARAATGRSGVIAFSGAFHGRTLLTMALTAKLAYKKGFGPFAPDVWRAEAPYPYRGVGTDEAIESLERLFKTDVDPYSVACLVLEPVQGEGGFIVMPPDYLTRLRELCDRYGILYVNDEVQSGVGRTGPVWAIEHSGVQPDLLVAGKSLGGGLPLASVTGRSEIMDAVEPGGLGGTFGGNPLACAAAAVVLDEVASPEFRRRADELGARIRASLEQLTTPDSGIGEVRGLGPMLAFEVVADAASRRPDPDRARRILSAALERGLLLLTCGLYGNVVRILVPITAEDGEIEEGLELLRQAVAAAR